MIAIQIARLIATITLFLESCGEELLDPDTAVYQMEILGADLQALDKGFLHELVDAFEVIAVEYKGDSKEMVRSIPHGFYLEEEIAADDPVKLAELDAKRDAMD